MIEKDISSRLIYFRGIGNIAEAHSKYDKPLKVDNGKCSYLARLELAPKGHPELTDNRLDMQIIDTYVNIYGKREGEMTSFENLVKDHTKFPSSKAKGKIPIIQDEIQGKFSNFNYNLNFLILSEFSGYWEGFIAHFDEEKTYSPIIHKACEEISHELELSLFS